MLSIDLFMSYGVLIRWKLLVNFGQLQFLTLSKLIQPVLHKLLHHYYVVFGGCRERGKRTIFAVGTVALQKTCFELQPGICLGIATKLLYGLV